VSRDRKRFLVPGDFRFQQKYTIWGNCQRPFPGVENRHFW
jgi:hypothetical protein